MTKKEIIRMVSEKTDLPQQLVKDVVQKTFESIIEVLVQDGRIELRNFGVFKVMERAARFARNPRSNEDVWVPEHETVTFKPGKVMFSQVQRERPKKTTRKKTVKKAKKVATRSTGAAETVAKAPKKTAKKVKKTR